MNERNPPPSLLGQALLDAIRQAVREEIWAITGQKDQAPALLTPGELASALKVPLSWVYEQSRQGKIPTRRLGRYIRFSLHDVIESQKNKA